MVVNINPKISRIIRQTISIILKFLIVGLLPNIPDYKLASLIISIYKYVIKAKICTIIPKINKSNK